jgi:predicted ATPase
MGADRAAGLTIAVSVSAKETRGPKATAPFVLKSRPSKRAMYIQSLHIKNFRCFENAAASFLHPLSKSPGGLNNINLILGDNGSGKSSVLKAIALSVLGSVLSDSGFRPYYLVRSKSKSGKERAIVKSEVRSPRGQRIFFQSVLEKYGVENSFDHSQTGMSENQKSGKLDVPRELRDGESSLFFICGFGASRTAAQLENYDRSVRLKGRSQRYQRVASLFEEHFTLTPFAPWIMSFWTGRRDGIPHRHFDLIAGAIEKLLNGTGITWTNIEEDEAEFSLNDDPGVKVPTDALSDGFRAYLSWVTDLLAQLAEVCPLDADPLKLPGVVLVDEVDLHLHPSWQRKLLHNLSLAFPALQFIVTSHSPILAGSLPPENIHVVDRTPDGPSVITRADKDYYGRAIDEILTGDYFELESVLPPELEAKRQKEDDARAELARQVLQTRSPEAAKAYLESLQKQ